MTDDTIFALASAPGRAGIAVVRISGPATRTALTELSVPPLTPRRAARAKFRDTAGELLDDGLVLWFPAPHSFTGEDVAELHLHGGRAIVGSVLEALAAIPGLRPAEPGEFTRRAFAHDKLDLTQAEALADAVDADTRAQARQALRQMGGALKERYDAWRLRIVHCLAHLEAVIDFPDEDLPADVADKIWPDIRDLRQDIGRHLDDAHRGERIRSGLRIAIVGPPNAGKSTLLNWLARREAAIVSDQPGTTRDVIEVHLDLAGFAVTIVDTAGLRETADVVEQEGVRRAARQAAEADIKVLLCDGAHYPAPDAAVSALIDENSLVVITKADLLSPRAEIKESGATVPLVVSVKTGVGLDELMARLQKMVIARCDAGTAAPLTRPRHRRALEDCAQALDRALAATAPELAAEDLRVAARALGRLTGRVEVDEILDVVFREFCIGK